MVYSSKSCEPPFTAHAREVPGCQQTECKQNEETLEKRVVHSDSDEDGIAREHHREIIINEALCYITCKMNVMPKNDLVKLVADFYDFDYINNAVTMLYRFVPDSVDVGRKKTRKGDQRKLHAAGDLYDVLQSCQCSCVCLPKFAAMATKIFCSCYDIFFF